MTALVFLLTNDEVCIATDSLALTTGGAPFKYISKVFPLPHLSGAMAGTGDLNIIVDWFVEIQKHVVARNFLYLNTVGADQLCAIASKYEHLEASTTTIYHFGYDETQRRFRGFALLSKRKFVVEELVYGLGVKPYGDELRAGMTEDNIGPIGPDLF